jgi:hypothetical protein
MLCSAGWITRMKDPDWWRKAAIYQNYPRSFSDRNADGDGDLAGVLSRIDHFAALGVDAVWFSPFYPSALTDGGYDARLGTRIARARPVPVPRRSRRTAAQRLAGRAGTAGRRSRRRPRDYPAAYNWVMRALRSAP